MKSVTKANSAMRNLTVAAATLSCMVICMFSYGARAAEFNLTPNQENAAPLTKLSADEGTEFVKEYYAALSRVDIPAVVAKFAETVDYEGEGQRDRSYIRSDLEKYVARFHTIAQLFGNKIVAYESINEPNDWQGGAGAAFHPR